MTTYHLASHRDRREAPGADPVSPAFEHVVGRSAALRSAVEAAAEIARRPNHPVFLVGESGTGKNLFARAIHYASPEADAPFVVVDCPNIPPPLLESELFGREDPAEGDAAPAKRGLVEVAEGGTLFLDEVDDLPLDLQPKLLRALEERRVRRTGGVREVNVRCRIIVASSRPLEDPVEEGRFREDLYYRLNVGRVDLPPLREREGDLPLLARHVLRTLCLERGLPEGELAPDALRALHGHRWPGNVRELEHAVRRAADLAPDRRIRAEHVVVQEREPVPADPGRRIAGRITIPSEGKTLEEIEAEALRLTLRITDGNKSAAARLLGCSRPTINRMIERSELGPDDWRADG